MFMPWPLDPSSWRPEMPRSIQEILDRLVDQSTVPIAIEPDPERMRPSDITCVVCDYGKLAACTDWNPRVTLATSLADALDDWRNREKKVSTE